MLTHHLIKRTLAGGLLAAAAVWPATAQAMPVEDPPASSSSAPAPIVSTPPPAAQAGSSFQWGDAGIGAAGAIVLVGMGAGTAGVVRSRRPHRTIAG